MDKLSLSSSSSPSISRPFLSPLLPFTRTTKRVSFNFSNPKKFSVFASQNDANDDDKLNQWDLMELKFGKMLGEDPKLTIAKIMGRKTNPDASYMEIEKSFYKNKGKIVQVKEVPFDVPGKRGLNKGTSGLNLVKPVPKKGIVVGGGENNSKLPDLKRPNEKNKNNLSSSSTKSNVPNVILRKPSVFDEKDDELRNSSKLKIKPNLSLSMRTEPVKEKFSGMTLLKKPELSEEKEDGGKNENNSTDGSVYSRLVDEPENSFKSDMADEGPSPMVSSDEVTLLGKPHATAPPNTEEFGSDFKSNGMDCLMEDHSEGSFESKGDLMLTQDGVRDIPLTGIQNLKQTDAGYPGTWSKMNKLSSVEATGCESHLDTALLGKPKRLDQSVKDILSDPIREGTPSTIFESFDVGSKQEELSRTQHLEETEEAAWAQVEKLSNLRATVDVELINCSPRGYVASFGSLIGFLPYRNLAAKWKFLAFESWLRKNGLDPSKYRQRLGIVGSDEVPTESNSHELSPVPESSQNEISADLELDDLLKIYDQKKNQYLSSYIGQHIRVNILSADRKSRKLIFSMRPREKEETVQKKRNLMAKLSVGDVVKCCVKKITYFGYFVEVEGVPALIHQTEVSWESPLDPASSLKIGQIVEAKVHQLDFALERIFLSLKEITPDPLNEALECIVGSDGCSGQSNIAQVDSEWAEVDSLVEELQKINGVQAVTKGRFFLSPGLAPTFQVYMASMFESQYKLLARSGNKVQELMVQASLDKEEMKAAILRCTNNVEL